MNTIRRRTATPDVRNQDESKKSHDVVLYHRQTQTAANQNSLFQQGFDQPIVQTAGISYLSSSLQLLAFFVLTIYARTYMAMLARELYPVVYSVAVGDVPSFYSLHYHMTYRPGLEYTVNKAYNYGPVVLTSSLFVAAKLMPVLVSGVKKTCSFLREALLGRVSEGHSIVEELDEDSDNDNEMGVVFKGL